MRRALILIVAVLLPAVAVGEHRPRPKIVGIVGVRLLVTDIKNAENFYYGLFRAIAPHTGAESACNWCERVPGGSGPGPIEFDVIHGKAPADLVEMVTFRTNDAKGLRDFLKQNKVKVGSLTVWGGGASFSVVDPEQHRLTFVEGERSGTTSLMGIPGAYPPAGVGWPHIIHAGWVVKDRKAMDQFYKDILGFHLYWQGGMKDGEISWVSMQVPDGTDWIEYMLNIPSDASKQLLGVMNHIAIGAPSVTKVAEELEANGTHLTEQPRIGRDGKWQLNLYDPDLTRVEFMEFMPVEKPCCSEFTGTHPRP